MLGAVLGVVLVVVGAGLLTWGAEAFAEHVATAARGLGVSVLALALLVAGAEPEEAVTSMIAAGQGHAALAAGDALGANVVILTLTLGLAALVTHLPVGTRVVQYAVAASAASLLATVLLWNGVLGRLEGAVLVLLYVAGVVWVWRREHEPPMVGEVAEQAQESHEVGETSDAGTSRALLWLLGGVLGMVLGGALAVRGAEGLVDAFGLTESVVGLTILALATSAEMLALVFAAARRGASEILVAGVVGSAAYNATVSLGLAGLVNPLVLGNHSPVLVAGAVGVVLPLVLLLGRSRGHLPQPLGVPLVAAYVAITAWFLTR